MNIGGDRFKVPYRDFVNLTKHFMKEPEPPVQSFGKVFCNRFGINNEHIRSAPSYAVARARIEASVEWVM